MRAWALAAAVLLSVGCERTETSHNARRSTLPDEEAPASVMATVYDFQNARQALEDMRRFGTEERWSEALGAAEAILRAEPNQTEAQQMLARAKLEGDGQLRLKEFNKRVNARDLPGAMKAYRQIADDSMYRERAQPELTRVQDLWLGATEAEARVAVRAGRCEDARRAVRMTGELFPESKARIEQIAAGCRPRAVAAAEDKGRDKTPEKAEGPTEKPAEVAMVTPAPKEKPAEVVADVRPEPKPAPVAAAPARPVAPARSPKLVTMPDLEKLRIAGAAHPELPGNIKRIMLRDQKEVRAVIALVVCVSEKGSVSSVQVKQPTEYTEVNKKIVADVRAWRFRPYLENGAAVPVCTGAIMQYRVTN
jgi:hypothetical protein